MLFCLFQVDNQQFGTVFPVALYPSPLPSFIIQRTGTYSYLACYYVIMGVVYQVRAHCNSDRTCNSLDKPRVLNNWLKYSADECFCSSFEDILRYAPAKSVKQSVKKFPNTRLVDKGVSPR